MSRSSTTTKRRLVPVQPGDLLEEFLLPLGLMQYRLAKGLRVPRRRINEICPRDAGDYRGHGAAAARFFGTSERFWLNLHTACDLQLQRDRLEREVQVLARAG